MELFDQELRGFNRHSIIQNVIYNYQIVESTWSHHLLFPDVPKREVELLDQTDGILFSAPHGELSSGGERAPETEISNDVSVVVPVRSTLEW